MGFWARLVGSGSPVVDRWYADNGRWNGGGMEVQFRELVSSLMKKWLDRWEDVDVGLGYRL
jgi:hypothetical protein